MVTEIGGKRRQHLYLDEWMAFRGRNPAEIGKRLNVSRTTVWRWVKEQHRLTPDKIAALAYGLDCEPEDLWRLPSRPSLDAIAKDAPDRMLKMAADLVRRIVDEEKTGTEG